jgi:hypothetical protein
MPLTMQASRPLYYFLVTAITQFVLAVGAMLVLAPTGLLAHLPLELLGGLLAYNVAIATLVAAIVAGNVGGDEQAVQRGAGLLLGHLVGLIVGGVVGGHYGGTLWAIAGAVVLYFVVGWIGSRISLAVGRELESLANSTVEPKSRIQLRTGKTNPSVVFFFGALIPLFLMMAAMLVRQSGLPVAQYSQVLTEARMVLVLLSLVSIVLPRIRRTHWNKRENTLTHEPMAPVFGLGLSLAPAFYGFLLFVAFGMSAAELSIFSVVAAIATASWGTKN